ncbi:hypothetical protein BKA70DRAFT_116206 [Coprinopsis sp. MPI-PUGE-AT-0042]|nr:hypothetical protein BKA70DRAFT_115326 [Coprinopsis sp. MPI-PUGE-AT-0042]KAH6910113.1 hypothetical protein BKA70DRAFT_116206 [Coprinopsis sp. MPI-PUGE-AT-0042]
MNRESQETGARRGRTYPPVPHKLSQEDGLYVEEANAPIQYFQINGGNFYSAGRDMHNHFYEAPKPTFDLLSALDSIDNFRQIQQDTLIKATPKTGEWVFQHEMFPVWRNPKSDVKTLWGSGIRKFVVMSSLNNHLQIVQQRALAKRS